MTPGAERLAISCIFSVNMQTGEVDWNNAQVHSLSISISISISIYLSIYLSVSLPIYLSLSISLSLFAVFFTS